MSRPKRRIKSAERDTFAIANQGLLRQGTLRDPVADLQQFEDRRSFYPGVYRPARTFRSRAHLALGRPPVKRGRVRRVPQLDAPISFGVPKQTLICVRRSQRREVLHALKKTGGRGGRQRRPRRSLFSSISCRR